MSDSEDSEDSDNCPICFEVLDDEEGNTHKLECGHVFHTNCIINSFRLATATCPICRAHPTGNPEDYRDPEVHLRAPLLVKRIRNSNKDIKEIIKKSNCLFKELRSKVKILNGLIKEKTHELAKTIEGLEEYVEYCKLLKEYSKFKSSYTRKMFKEVGKKDKASATFFKNGFCGYRRYYKRINHYNPTLCINKLKRVRVYSMVKF